MTKLRPALSPHAALLTIAEGIGWPRICEIVGRRDRTVRKWSEHDVGTNLPLEAASRLDLEYLAAGGQIAPFEAWYRLQRRLHAAAYAAAVACPHERIAIAARETGEAIHAHLIAARPGAAPADLRRAKRETEEAIVALSHTLPDLSPPSPAPEVR